jgi:two-component system sensor histidine kinase ChiS
VNKKPVQDSGKVPPPTAVGKTRLLPYLAGSLAVVVVLAVVWVFDRSERERFQEQNRANVLTQLSTVRARLEKALNQRLFLTRGLVAYVSTINPNLDQETFEKLAKVIVAQQPGIRSVALYKNTVGSHIYPLKGNEAVIGFSPMSILKEREAIKQAIENKKTIVAGPIDLVEGGVAFIGRTPIFLTPSGTGPESGSYWGLAGIILDRDTLFKEAGLLEKSAPLQYTLRGKDGLGAKGEVFFGETTIFQQNPMTLEVTLPNGSWQLAAIPAGGWLSSPPISKWLWIAGGVTAFLAGGLVFILVSTPTRLRQAIDQATAALRHSEEELKRANEELQYLDKLKDEFLANTSHELRTPLNGIIGIAESLMDGVTGDLPQPTRSNLAMIVSSGRRLSNLVNDILDFSQLRHKNIELQLKPVDVGAIADVVLTLSQPLVGNKELQLVNAIPDHLPPVYADENRLQQILYNLIGNAIKFTASGTVKVSAALLAEENTQLISSPLSGRGGEAKPQIEITVSDTGIGIPEDQLERIFKSFEQAAGSTSREYGGTGLGLAVTKQLVELHGGKINVNSQVGVGSQFAFTLAISPGKVEKAPPKNALKESFRSSSLETKLISLTPSNTRLAIDNPQDIKVLIVDDEPINLQVLTNYLSLQNYAIAQANNGEEALALMEQGLKPDIILLDVMMPKMTGYEVTQKLRDRFSAAELPIILLTAKNQVQDIVTGLNVGANDYLTKPIGKDELFARMRTHINLCRLKAENLRMKAELEVAQKLQQMVLPKESELNSIDGLEIAAFMEPADEVGGDYYDVLKGNRGLKISIGDVTGHGLESGVLMLMVQTAVRTLQESQVNDPVKFLDILNRTIYGNIQRLNSDKNLTLALLDYSCGQLSLSGQHEEMIVVRSGGEIEHIDTIDLGFPIGLDQEIAKFISQEKVYLNSGDVAVLYTDGITEAENINKVQYGLERLCEVVRRYRNLGVTEIKEALISDLRQHIGEQNVFDDITLLVMKQK